MRSLLSLLTLCLHSAGAGAHLYNDPPGPFNHEHAASFPPARTPANHPPRPPRLSWCLDYGSLARPELDFGPDAETLFAGASDGLACATDGLVVSAWLAARSYGYATDYARREVVYLVGGRALLGELGGFLRDAVWELGEVRRELEGFGGRFLV